MIPVAWLGAKLGLTAMKHWRLIVMGLAAVAICATIGAAFHSYNKVVAQNAILSANVAKLETAVQTEKAANDAAKAAITRWKKAEAEARQRAEELAKGDEAARRDARRVDEFFATRSLLAEMLAHPDAVGRDALRTYRRLWRLFECASAPNRRCPNGHRRAERDSESPAP